MWEDCGKVKGRKPFIYAAQRASPLKMYGRNERIRTSDPFVPNEVRYQAALHSDLIDGGNRQD
jgi:hypothetical protein